jgi:hypothetical protein
MKSLILSHLPNAKRCAKGKKTSPQPTLGYPFKHKAIAAALKKQAKYNFKLFHMNVIIIALIKTLCWSAFSQERHSSSPPFVCLTVCSEHNADQTLILSIRTALRLPV